MSEMISVEVASLDGVTLDWAVAKCEGSLDIYSAYCEGEEEKARRWYRYWQPGCERYSTDWSQGGLIIERERITVSALYAQNDSPIDDFKLGEWGAYIPYGTHDKGRGAGPTPLIAAMRCYVTSKLGPTVEVPAELFSEPANTLKRMKP